MWHRNPTCLTSEIKSVYGFAEMLSQSQNDKTEREVEAILFKNNKAVQTAETETDCPERHLQFHLWKLKNK